MSWVKTEKSNYQAIASAIRTKSGSADTFLPSEMAGAIGALETVSKTVVIKQAMSYFTNSTGLPTTKTFTITSTGSAVGSQNKFYAVSVGIHKDGGVTNGYYTTFYKRDGDTLTQLNYNGGTYDLQTVTGSMTVIENGVSLTIDVPVANGTTIYVLTTILALE